MLLMLCHMPTASTQPFLLQCLARLSSSATQMPRVDCLAAHSTVQVSEEATPASTHTTPPLPLAWAPATEQPLPCTWLVDEEYRRQCREAADSWAHHVCSKVRGCRVHVRGRGQCSSRGGWEGGGGGLEVRAAGASAGDRVAGRAVVG
ncbi:hypothetical protein V8C86DRAFT_1144895 [Haematococcus lacustris]